MFMFRKILVPLDGSEVAESVLPYAEEIATKCGSEIVLVSVSDVALGDMRNLYLPYLERTAERVKQQLKDWGASKETAVQMKPLIGKPADEILQYADENRIDLIVMSSRGAGKGAWAVGNIAWKVLQAAGEPVLLIRTPANREAIEQKKLLKKILVPLDGSEIGGSVIPYVETLAQALGAEIILFHILEAPTVGVLAPGIEIAYRAATMETERNVHQKYLNEVEKRMEEKGLSTSIVMNMGPAPDEIMKYAENNAVDLIAMSTHGRSGIRRWVFGSVTHRVLQAGNTAVLTVRAKG